MGYIHVNQLNFEFEESNVYHDILLNSGHGSQSTVDQITSVAHIYVDYVNLQIPVSEVTSELLTNVGTATHTLDEQIIGTPVAEPEIAVGGGAGQRPRVLGGRPYVKETLTSISANAQEIEETRHVYETVQNMAQKVSHINATIRRPVYRRVKQTEILPYVMVPPSEAAFTSRSRKEEEELILLGII